MRGGDWLHHALVRGYPGGSQAPRPGPTPTFLGALRAVSHFAQYQYVSVALGGIQ
jgi:hypothetical protein